MAKATTIDSYPGAPGPQGAGRYEKVENALDVVRSLFQGGTEAVIAEKLGLSIHTVHSHIDRIYRKLGVNRRSALLVRIFNEYLTLADHDVFRTRDQARRGPRRHLIATSS